MAGFLGQCAEVDIVLASSWPGIDVVRPHCWQWLIVSGVVVIAGSAWKLG